ncbi:Uncharacterized protein TCM_019604 [Theobroma cacao]|uniref:Uncharacterized protein n=1 Tax=Theobroma cacao TaxID=3641 RepID=A0A061EHI2_THECC|nr:Uncharacterized protein TCM_019604 [Theobroma cacao]
MPYIGKPTMGLLQARKMEWAHVHTKLGQTFRNFRFPLPRARQYTCGLCLKSNSTVLTSMFILVLLQRVFDLEGGDTRNR